MKRVTQLHSDLFTVSYSLDNSLYETVKSHKSK